MYTRGAPGGDSGRADGTPCASGGLPGGPKVPYSGFMSIPVATLMCHAPIVIPDVGKENAPSCQGTTRAMSQVAERMVAARPDAVVVISPHTPRAPDDWRLVEGERVRGTFEVFGAPRIRIDLPAAKEARSRIARLGLHQGIQTAGYEPEDLDHGATVPLWFLQQAGWSGPTLVIALPWREGTEELMGEAIRVASGSERWGVVASGDMSHRLRAGAPAGFDPRAQSFDDAVVEALRAGDLRAVAELDPSLRKLAAEDVVASVTVAAAAVGFRSDNHQVFHYEGPFGVGYCAAVLFDRSNAGSPTPGPRVSPGVPSRTGRR